jgi:hypothetical protein
MIFRKYKSGTTKHKLKQEKEEIKKQKVSNASVFSGGKRGG